MRTASEIVKRVLESNSMFGFESEVFISYLTFSQARALLKPEATEEGWGEVQNVADARAHMAAYVAEVGWPKASGHRGISAGRTIEKVLAWLWLLEDDETAEKMNAAPYPQYGCPKLAALCARYDLPVPQDEAVQRMIAGEPCSPDCEMGCGT